MDAIGDEMKSDAAFHRNGHPWVVCYDKDGHVMEDWGAFGEKLFFGKLVQGVLRSTFLIGGEGKIAKVWKVDKVKGHAADVLAHLKA